MSGRYDEEAVKTGRLAGLKLIPPPPDRDHAELFLEALGAATDLLHWQTFDDAKLGRPLVKKDLATHHDVRARLAGRSAAGAGVFVTANVVDCRDGAAKNKWGIVLARALFTDNDHGPPPPGGLSALPPSMIIASQAGPRCCWLLDRPCDLDTARTVEQSLAVKLYADPAAADPARVVRVPGFPHQKDPATPFDVRIIHYDPELRYPVADFRVLQVEESDWRSYKDWYGMWGQNVPFFHDARAGWEAVRGAASSWRTARGRFNSAFALVRASGMAVPDGLEDLAEWDATVGASTWKQRGEWALWRAAAVVAGTDEQIGPDDARWPGLARVAGRWAAKVQAAVKGAGDMPEAFSVAAAPQAAATSSRPLGRMSLSLLDVVALFRAQGLYICENDGKHNVICPWDGEHGGPSTSSATVIFDAVPFERGPGFNCMHAHCVDRDMRAVVDHFGDAVVGHLRPIEEAAGAVLDAAIAALASNAGALFEPVVLAAAAATWVQDPAAFERLYACLRRLPRGTVRMGDWSKAVGRQKQQQTDERRGARGHGAFELGDEAELAAALLKEVRGGGEPAVYDVGYIHAFDETTGLWTPLDDAALGRRIQAWSGVQVGHGENAHRLHVNKRTVDGAIKLAAMLPCDGYGEGFFAAAPRGVMFANGFLRIDDTTALVFEAPSPDHRQRIALPFDYDKNATALRFMRYLEEVFEGDADKAQKIRLVQQFVGACLMGLATTYQKVLMLYGEGRNGKSVLIDVVSALFPAGMRAAVAPQHFSNDDKCILLVGVRLNVVNEIPENDITEGSGFKSVVDGSEVTARQVFKPAISFRPEAGHLFAANDLPGSRDKSLGFWRRWLVVDFNREFEGGKDEKGLGDKIVASEMPGIAAWAARGAVDLLASGDYAVPQSCVDRIEQWRHDADPVRLFLDECAAPLNSQDHWTPAKTLYDRFALFSEQNGFARMSSAKFGKRVKRYVQHKKSNGSKYLVRLRI